MYQLRCTKKVQDLLNVKPSDLAEPTAENFALGCWYVNTFTQNRKKCLLFVEESTLMSFVLTGFRKEHIKNFPFIFKAGLLQLLRLEKIPTEIISSYESGTEDLIITKTLSKKTLGNMNDLLSLYQHFISYDGGLEYCDLDQITMRANRTPQRNLEWSFSVEALHKRLLTNITNN
jgi:hypothetical protein